MANTGLLLIPLAGFAAGFVATWAMRFIAPAVSLVDHPDGRRKLHSKSIPLGGGVGVFVGMLFALLATAITIRVYAIPLPFEVRSCLGLFAAAGVLVVVGLIDDKFHLRGRQKLVGQILSTLIVVATGLAVERINLFGTDVELGPLAVPLTICWLLGSINAFNLIDGSDGLAGSVGVILSLAIAGMAMLTGHTAEAMISLALCGSLLGFLVFNFPPASIFLGDAGSMLIGLMLGVLAIRSSLKAPTTVALAAPLLIWTIPAFDVGMAILRRKLTGRSIYETDRAHLHHCLLRRGYSQRNTVLWIGLFCAICAGGALLSVARRSEALAVITGLTVIATLVVSRMFGHSEVLLLGQRVRGFLMSLVAFTHESKQAARQPLKSRWIGTRDWDELWKTLVQYAERFDLTSVQLNVNLPALNEEFHATWERRDPLDLKHRWTAELPLKTSGNVVGRIRIAGHCVEESLCLWMGDLIAGLKPFELQMQGLLADVLVLGPAPDLLTATRVDSPSPLLSAHRHEDGVTSNSEVAQ